MEILRSLKDFSWLYCLIAVGIIVFCYNLKLAEKNNEINALKNSNVELKLYIKQQNIATEEIRVAGEKERAEQYKREQNAVKNMEAAKESAVVFAGNSPSGCEEGRLYLIRKAQELVK